jgi:hypothetical protein
MKSLTLQQKDAGNLADGTGNHIVYSFLMISPVQALNALCLQCHSSSHSLHPLSLPLQAGQNFHIKIFEKQGNSVIALEPT